MANELIIDHPHCRVWQASEELTQRLPPVNKTPKHEIGHIQQIDVDHSFGLHWVTCVTCDWHTDWEEVFEFVLVRGTVKLYFDESKPISCSARRGTIIQLWPMLSHRAGVFGDAAFIELSGLEQPIFKSQEEQEATFIKEIKDNFIP